VQYSDQSLIELIFTSITLLSLFKAHKPRGSILDEK